MVRKGNGERGISVRIPKKAFQRRNKESWPKGKGPEGVFLSPEI